MTFTRKYRPQRFDEMVGQPLTAVVLQQMVATDTVPEALLFSGPRGTGKTSAARMLAMELNPDDRDSILAGTSLSVLEIDAASHGSVADIRTLVEQLRYSVGAAKRVIILDEAHSITREGFNALLKTLEEPPENVVFVLVTTEPQKLPETILSRVMEFEFRRVQPTDILVRLTEIFRAEQLMVEQALLQYIAETSDGSVRDAVKRLDYVHRARIEFLDEYRKVTGQHDVAPLLFAAMLTNDHAKIFSVLDEAMLTVGDPRYVSDSLNELITDLFILKSDGAVKASGRALDARLRLAKAVPSENLYSAVAVLWDLKTKVRQSEDARGALSMAIILMASRLSEGILPAQPNAVVEKETPVVSEEEARPMSLSELQQS